MSFYANMTADADSMLYQGKYDKTKEDNFVPAAFKLWNLSFSAAPKSGVTMNHTWTKQQDYDDKANVFKVPAEKTASKVGIKHDDSKWDIAAANDKFSVKVGGPLVTDDWKVNGTAMFTGKPTKSEYIVEAASSITSPDMSGVKAFMNLGVEMTQKPLDVKVGSETKKEQGFDLPKIKFDLNLALEGDMFIGANVEHNTSDVKELSAAFVKKDEGNKYWLNYDHQHNKAGLGCLINYADKNFTHAYEAVYETAAKNGQEDKLFGQPLTVAVGGKYVLSKETTMTYSAEFGKSQSAQAKFDYKLDKNWKASVQQRFDAGRVGTKNAPYELGFDIAYTL
jgi:hypothetical protein